MAFADKYKNNVGRKTAFKAKDWGEAYAFLIEPKSFVPDAPNPFAEVPDRSKFDAGPLGDAKFMVKQEEYEKRKTRAELIAAITVFQTPEHLDRGEGIDLGEVLVTGYLAIDLQRSIDGVEVQRLSSKVNSYGNTVYSWRSVDGPIVEKVGAYYDAREAALKAALAGDDVPDYLK